MLLNILGLTHQSNTLSNLTTVGFVWYYFNVLAITVIIYMVLKLAIVRAGRARTDRFENMSKSDNQYIKFVMLIATFGIIYFLLREYIDELKDLWSSIFNYAEGLING